MNSDTYFNCLLKRENINICAIPNHFTSSYVLMIRNGMPMTVADLLDRIENAISFIKANFNVDQEKFANTLKVLKFVKSCIDNRHPKRPYKKCILDFIEVVHEIEDMYAKNDIEKQKNEEIATTMKLLVNIFIKE